MIAERDGYSRQLLTHPTATRKLSLDKSADSNDIVNKSADTEGVELSLYPDSSGAMVAPPNVKVWQKMMY